MVCNVLAGNMPFDVTEEDIRAHFKVGKWIALRSVSVLIDRLIEVSCLATG